MKNNNDDIYRLLANHYIDAQGKDLLKELESTPFPGSYDGAATGNTDLLLNRKLKEIKHAKKRRIVLTLSSAAACFLLIILSVTIFYLTANFNKSSVKALNSSSNTAANSPQVISLTLRLPERMSVSSSEQDRNQSVYRLADRYGDNVVMTLENGDGSFTGSGMNAVQIEGKTVYCLSGDYYNMVIFQQKGVLYTMTCHYEMDTLYELSEKILQQV